MVVQVATGRVICSSYTARKDPPLSGRLPGQSRTLQNDDQARRATPDLHRSSNARADPTGPDAPAG